MPKKRLNITLDHDAAERARRYTQRHNTSISRLVGEFLSQLPREETDRELTPTVSRLLGVAKGGPDREQYRRRAEIARLLLLRWATSFGSST